MTKLWFAIALLVVFAISLAYGGVKSNPGVEFETIKAGEGASPTVEDVVLVNYTGKLDDGTVFDQGERTPLPVAGLVPGFTEALLKMQKGGKYHIVIPPALGYGDKASGPIPAGSTISFDVELLEFKSRAEVEAMQRQMQMMQQQQGAGAPPPGAMPQGIPGQ